MPALLNADEVLGIAIQIESNGASFYRKAAELNVDQKSKDFLLKLAEVEDGHKARFAEMKTVAAQATEQPRDTLSSEGLAYLSVVSDNYRIEGSPAATASLTGTQSMTDILRTAIELEKESILFYVAVKDVLAADDVRSKVDEIVREEAHHVVVLSKELEALLK